MTTQQPKKNREDRHELEPANWIAEYGDYLLAVANNRVRDRATAEDLVQDTFVSAWNARERFRGDSSERTWLLSILRNKIIDHYRSNARRSIFVDTESFGRDDDSRKSFDERSEALDRSWHGDPEREAEQVEFFKVLDEALEMLPAKTAAAFRMREIQGLSTEEITRSLKISQANLWVLIHRAKKSLQRHLQTLWINPGFPPGTAEAA